MHAAHNQPYTGYQFKGTTQCVNGLADGFPCQNIDLVGHLDLPAIGGGQGSDSWGWKDEASGRYFALVGRSNGTSFIEITNPQSPQYIGQLPSEAGLSSTWRDIKTYNGYAYIVADIIGDHGMQVFDLSQLLNAQNMPVTFSAASVYKQSGFQEAHNIVINEDSGFAYLTGGNTCDGGLHMVDINTPSNPTFAGCFSADGYTHDAQCLNYSGPDTDYHGKEICIASNEDTVTVVDVSVKSTPTLVSRTGYTGSQYTHQGWFTEDQKYFVIDDELDERRDDLNTRTLVMDMTNLDQPVFKGFHEAGGASIDHNQYIVGNHTYQANYSRGLRVLRLKDLSKAEMEEVAYFDTVPKLDSNQSFQGAWNVYPFFDNGMVIISDINSGIFILKVNLPVDDLIFESGFEID
nr:choice-of-anchor B family protein [Marinicella rhabdoformis]